MKVWFRIIGIISLVITNGLINSFSTGVVPSQHFNNTVRVIIQLDDSPIATLKNPKIEQQQSYAINLEKAQNALLQTILSQGISIKVNRSFRFLYNGLAVSILQDDQTKLSSVSGVRSVFPDTLMWADLSISVPLIGAPTVWTIKDNANNPVDGTGMVIAVLDTGVDYSHPDFGGCFGISCKVMGGYDLVNNDNDPKDDNGHGTHVAGIIASNGILKGVAPGAKLLAYKVLNNQGAGVMSDIIAALEMAADPDGNPATQDGADVANLSLGGQGTPDDPLSQAVDSAVNQGMVVVVTAGNHGDGYQTLGSPGVSRNALTVGASDKTDVLASFSSRGPVDGDLDEFKPDVIAPGVTITSTVPVVGPLGNPSRYRSLSGTSMAAPHVAGAAALLHQLHPNWTPSLIKAALMNTSKKIGEDLFTTGAGRIQVAQAAVTPLIAFPGALTFGKQTPGTQVVRTFEVANVSEAPIMVSVTIQLSQWLDPYYQYAGGVPVDYVTPSSQTLSLIAGETTTLSITLASPPDALEGFYFGSATLTFAEGNIEVPLIAGILTGNYPPNPNRLIGQMGGLMGGMEVRGDLVYVGLGPRMVILSVKDKAHPQIIGQTEPGPGTVWALAIFGQYAMVSFNGHDTGIFDITDPTNIFRVGTLEHKNVSIGDIRVKGHYAFMSANLDLWVVDISYPAHPYLVNQLILPSASNDLEIDGNYAYIAEGYDGVQLIDISDPLSPQPVGIYNSEGYAKNLEICNHLVFLGDDEYYEGSVHKNGGLRILDFSNPISPQQIGYFDFNLYGFSSADTVISVQADRAYITLSRAGGEQIFILNVAQPSNPTHINNFNGSEWPDHAYYIKFLDGYLFASMPNSGMDIFDLRNVSSPSKTAHFSIDVTYIRALARQGDYLYLAESKDLYVYDLYNPIQPVRKGICHFPMENFSFEIQKVIVAGNYAYIAASSLKICDVSNPVSPVFLTELKTSGMAVSVAVSGKYIYVVEGGIFFPQGGALIIYEHKSSSFQKISTLLFGSEQLVDIALKDGFAYLTTQGENGNPSLTSGVHIVDVHNPAAPVKSGFLSYPGKGPQGIVVVGNYAYLALTADKSLKVLDLSQPDVPVETGSYSGDSHLQFLIAGGNYAYIMGDGAEAGGIYIFDISNPLHPQKNIQYPDYCGTMGSAVAGNTIYISSWGCGLIIGNFSPRSMHFVRGNVYDENGHPLSGVFVTDTLGNIGKSKVGGYQVDGVMPGRNQLTAIKDGCTFQPAEAPFVTSPGGIGPNFYAIGPCQSEELMYLPLIRR